MSKKYLSAMVTVLVTMGTLLVPSAHATLPETQVTRDGNTNPVAGSSSFLRFQAGRNGAGVNVGTIDISVNSVAVCTGLTVSAFGFAQCSYTFSTAGTYSVRADYTDSSNTYQGSFVTVSMTVDPAPSITIGAVTGNPAAGTASTATIAVTSVGIANNQILTTNWSNALGSTSGITAPTGITKSLVTIVGGAGTLTFNLGANAVQGTYYVKISSNPMLYAVATLVVGAAGQQQNNTTIDAVAEAAKRAAAVASAKAALTENIKAGKSISAADLTAADFNVNSPKVAERVAARLTSLPLSERSDLGKIQEIVRTENFVDKVSNQSTQSFVTTSDLILEGLLSTDYKFKATVVRALKAANPSELTTIEKVKAAVEEVQAKVQARQDRLKATIAKITNRS